MDDQAQSTHEFKIDLKGIIKLLAQHLYPEKDVFVREMLQNAYDSISRRRAIEGDRVPAGAVHVRIDSAHRRISFSDNGQGLTESEIHNHLATIGRSGTEEFRQKLIKMGRRGAVSLIGQFGIGLLSTFVVAEYVEVVTRSHLADQPICRWVSYGEKDYTLEKLTLLSDSGIGTPPMTTKEQGVFQLSEYSRVGTTVTLHIAAGSNDDLLQVEVMRKIIRKYADFLSAPIYLNDEPIPTNAITPPWQQIYTDGEDRQKEYFAFLKRRYPDLILHVIPVNITSPLRIYGVLYVSERRVLDLHATGSVDLYHIGMFVQSSNREILPVWAKFVRGILDSPDLTLTLARDGVQKDSTFFCCTSSARRSDYRFS